MSIVDIQTIGTGGGSIAWMENGAMRVGPHSAGSIPGPPATVAAAPSPRSPTPTCTLAASAPVPAQRRHVARHGGRATGIESLAAEAKLDGRALQKASWPSRTRRWPTRCARSRSARAWIPGIYAGGVRWCGPMAAGSWTRNSISVKSWFRGFRYVFRLGHAANRPAP